MKSFFYIVLIGACLSFKLSADYSTVNGLPQLASDADHFSFYWSVWRDWKNKEKEMLVSERSLNWELRSCDTKETVSQKAERFWYLDVDTIAEANWSGHLYLNLINFNSLFAKTHSPYLSLKRLPNESLHEYQKRNSEAYQKWRASLSMRGHYGVIHINADHRLVPTLSAEESAEFIRTTQYENPSQLLFEKFLPYKSDRWPVYFDERAHKPHAIEKPSIWEKNFISQTVFVARLDWNACDEKIKATFVVPKGGLPAPGPNRPGRPTSNTNTLTIREE